MELLLHLIFITEVSIKSISNLMVTQAHITPLEETTIITLETNQLIKLLKFQLAVELSILSQQQVETLHCSVLGLKAA